MGARSRLSKLPITTLVWIDLKIGLSEGKPNEENFISNRPKREGGSRIGPSDDSSG